MGDLIPVDRVTSLSKSEISSWLTEGYWELTHWTVKFYFYFFFKKKQNNGSIDQWLTIQPSI